MKTYNAKLNFNPASAQEDEEKLLATLELHKNIWNEVSKFIFDNNMTTNYKLVHDKMYHPCMNQFPNTPSQIVVRVLGDAVATYKTLKQNIRSGLIDADATESACDKKNLSIRLDKRLYVLTNNSIKLTVVNSPNRRITCSFEPYPKLKEMMQYSVCDPLIFYKDKTFWLSLTFDTPEPVHVENQCLGIDLGLKRFAVTSEGLIISGKEMIKQKRKIRYMKRKLQQIKRLNKHFGYKTDSARKKLRKLKNKEKNIAKNFIHLAVNEVLKTNCNTIVIEDLGKIKKQNKEKSIEDKDYKYQYKGKKFNSKRSQVPWHQFKTVLIYKANSLGKRVVTVNPAFTSKDDYRTASDSRIIRGERKGCRYYASDGKVFDADGGAAVTIAMRYGNKTKLPVAFAVPLDGTLRTIRAGSSQRPERWSPVDRQANDL